MRSYFSRLLITSSVTTILLLGCSGGGVSTGGGSATSASTSTTTGAGGSGSTSSTGGVGGAITSGTGAGGAGGSVGADELGPFTCSGVIVTYAADVAPLFAGCSGGNGCHSIATGFQTPTSTYAYLVGQESNGCMDGRLRVAPGDPEHSYVINKLANHDLCGGSGMPKGPGFKGVWKPRPESEVQTIYDWICTGAKND